MPSTNPVHRFIKSSRTVESTGSSLCHYQTYHFQRAPSGGNDKALLKMHPKKTSKKTIFTQTTEEYASRSSIHGIGYIFDRELGIFDRVLWLLVVLVFLAVAAALTMNLWTQWRNEQVMKTIREFCSDQISNLI